MIADLTCSDERRRGTARAAERNGIDSITVNADQYHLTVRLFGNAPEDLGPENFRIEGGRQVTGIEVEAVDACADEDPETADCVELTVDRPGDYSTYRLCVVEADPHGRPGTRPYPAFDPRYACAEFSFKQNCAGLLDCASTVDCPPATYPEPAIDYLAKDYASFRQLLLDRLSLTMPDWTERHEADLGIALVEMLAYVGDQLSYHQDAVATEAYLDTARLRVSVRRHVRLVDYTMHDGCAARAWVCVETNERLTLPAGDFRFVTLDARLVAHRGAAQLAADLATRAQPANPAGPGGPGYEVFEPVHDEDVDLYPAHNEIHLWTWGNHDCCLPVGAIAATLVDSAAAEPAEPADPEAAAADPERVDPERADSDPDRTVPEPGGRERILRLRPGDVLIFEELRDPKTGGDADADPTHRQAVRLTSVTPATDELYDQPLLEVTWDPADALTFPLCVNARGGPDCADIEVAVARGNVVLVEHGRSLDWCDGDPEVIQLPRAAPDEPGCPDPVEFGCVDRAVAHRPAYPPIKSRTVAALQRKPVTQSAPFPAPADVARAQAQRLLGLPDRARARLRQLWRAVRHGGRLSDADVEYLTVLFGERVLRRVGLREDPQHALRVLLARFDDLLADKLRRLAELVRRARGGYVLDPGNEGWEIAQTWGAAEGERIGPADPAFRGPAGLALRPDPRAALPALRVRLDGDDGPPWLPRRDLLDSVPTDRHVVGEVDDDGVLNLRFGDGTAGAVPPPGATLRVGYRVGNGPAGNVGRQAINGIAFCSTNQAGITRVRNPMPAEGGTAPEPVAEVRLKAPYEPRRRLLRAVTAEDYATLAGQVPGLQRAAAELRWTGSWYEARVALDPLGASVASQRLIGEVGHALHRCRRIGHDLSVATAALVPLDAALRVQVEPEHIAGHVREAVLRVLGSGVLPDGRLGFFHSDNLTFGTPVRVSQLVAAAARVPGVRHVEVTRLRRLFGVPEDALDTGLLVLRPLEIAQLDNDPTRPDNGRLTLDLRGGR